MAQSNNNVYGNSKSSSSSNSNIIYSPDNSLSTCDSYDSATLATISKKVISLKAKESVQSISQSLFPSRLSNGIDASCYQGAGETLIKPLQEIAPRKINVVKLSDWVVNDLWKDAYELYAAEHYDVEFLKNCSFYFQDNRRVKIPFVAYVKRLKELTECSDNCFLLALLLFDRLNKKKRLIYTRLNVHKLMAVCLWLSVKFYEDINFTDAYYAEKVAGIPLKELVELQFELLDLLNWRLLISRSRFNHFVQLIHSLLASSPLIQ